MISKCKKAKIRSTIFQHLDGVAISTTLLSLQKNGIIDFIINTKTFDSIKILKNFKCNIGYLNIALRLLSSQGLLIQRIQIDGKNINYTITEKGEFVFKNIKKYEFCLEWYKFILNLNFDANNNAKQSKLKKYKKNIKNNNDTKYNLYITKHLNGILISPLIAKCGFENIFTSNQKLKKFIKKNDFNKILGEILSIEGWLDDCYNYTDQGKYAFKISSSYGVTISYLETFINVNNLIFHDPTILKINTGLNKEIHINRKMNVWGSGGSHKTYFKHIDKIIKDIFNQPIESQPKGIADMGCGNGDFLIHINSIIKNTKRGKNIKQFPLYLIGADFNQEALEETNDNLTTNSIKPYLIKADISNPHKFAKDLQTKYKIDLKECLNIRSFLDHNRIYLSPKNTEYHESKSTCTFSKKGKWISNYILEKNLIEHFKKWKPYIEKFGLIALELHTIDPALTSKNLGVSISTAYDATHGYSDQYIIEIDNYLKCIKKAELKYNKNLFKKYPNNELASISINFIK